MFARRDKKNEQVHDKTNKMACAPSEDSDQLGHPPSLIRAFAVHSMGRLLLADNKDSALTGWMPRLIGVFAGCRFCRFCDALAQCYVDTCPNLKS